MYVIYRRRFSMSEADSCRICLDTEGQLIRPCKCKGSIGKVHETCLNDWRAASTNPHSKIRCDQCKHHYSFRRPAIATVLQQNWVILFLSVLCFSAIAYTLGYLLCSRSLTYVHPSTFMERTQRYTMIGGMIIGVIGIITLLIGPVGILVSQLNWGIIYPNSIDSVTFCATLFLAAGCLKGFFEVYLLVQYMTDLYIIKTEYMLENVE